MKKIVVFNQKGGTGKTSSTVNIAGCLEKNFGKKVLVVDCDSQINTTSYLLTQENCEPEKDVLDCIENNTPIEEVIKRVYFKIRKLQESNIWLIPGSKRADFEDISDPMFFDKLIKPYEKEFDYCFFDCPANITNFTIAALSCSDYVIVPALADTDSLGGLDLLIDTINNIRESSININIKILGILFNNVESVNALSKYIINSCRENMGDMVFTSYIRHSSAVAQARFYGKPINYYKPSAAVTKDYMLLTQEIIDKIEG